jgi:hypothetical protein
MYIEETLLMVRNKNKRFSASALLLIYWNYVLLFEKKKACSVVN